MRGERVRWRSSATAMEMTAVRWGRSGVPIVYIPTSRGDVTECQRYGLERIAATWVESGRAQLIATEGHGPLSLFNFHLPPIERIRRYAAYERYMVEEFLPWVRDLVPGTAPIVVGASYGAFVAANLLFKRPDLVGSVCGLGGVYGMWHCLDGHHDDDVYFHTPLEYLPRLEDPRALAAIRGTGGFSFFGAAADPWLDSTLRMARVMAEKELPHSVEIWPAPADHHEHWWRLQFSSFLERRC